MAKKKNMETRQIAAGRMRKTPVTREKTVKSGPGFFPCSAPVPIASAECAFVPKDKPGADKLQDIFMTKVSFPAIAPFLFYFPVQRIGYRIEE
ncbi:MAG: hypothetical protein ACXVBR_06875 [Flavisolibacter sp.]